MIVNSFEGFDVISKSAHFPAAGAAFNVTRLNDDKEAVESRLLP
jgi:hypothetical protein